MAERMFPILFGYRVDETVSALKRAGQSTMVVAIPWAMIAPHERQARANHYQSLERLAERGGLSADEAVAVLSDTAFERRPFKGVDANRRLAEMLVEFAARMPIVAGE
jgi:hypothetical protein